MMVYLLKSSYAGYDDAVKRGLEIDKIIESFKKSNDDGKNIKVSDLSQFIYGFLKPYVQDSHFSIECKDFSRQLITQHRVIYSNIYVKKINDSFVVEKSDNQDLKAGENLECKSENLFLYPSEGSCIYRIGTYATIDENEKYIFAICSGNEKQLLCDISNNYLASNNITTYKEIETEDSVYIYIPILMDLQDNDSQTGKNSCSSSEDTILEAKILFSKTKQYFQIGENTAGCYNYGNVWCYQLNNSGIALHLPSFITPFADKCPEGSGILPDFWATNEDIVQAIVNITGDIELSEKLRDINNNL